MTTDGPFTPGALAKAVHDTLDDATAAIPPGKRAAILLDASTDDGVRALFVEKVNDHWQVSLQGAWTGDHVAGKVATAVMW